MSQRMFITAAPVGAVPLFISSTEPKFLAGSHPALASDAQHAGQSIGNALEKAGWERADAGGLLFTASSQKTRLRVPCALIAKLPKLRTQQDIVLALTGSGWQVTGDGHIAQTDAAQQAFLAPALVQTIEQEQPDVLQGLLEHGAQLAEAGYWNPMRAGTPYLPITPDAIVAASIAAAQEGAAIIHLHTRDTTDAHAIHIPGIAQPIWISQQRNHIDADQYEHIVSALHEAIPAALINLSTSVRGGGEFESPIRRSHLRPYGDHDRTPEFGSFSTGPVIFQAGGGYENPPRFLDAQFAHYQHHGVRPEVEVFNGNILDLSLGEYAERLRQTGEPVVFMLVAGVDQHRRVDGGVADDSLISPEERKAIVRLVVDGDPKAREQAIQRTVASLRPTVERIRNEAPGAVISSLMPGPLLQILPDVAVQLGLDGVRVGLEDALNVPDERVPGGLRKATTADQVRFARQRLEALGVEIVDAEQLRDQLHMPLEIPQWQRRRIAVGG